MLLLIFQCQFTVQTAWTAMTQHLLIGLNYKTHTVDSGYSLKEMRTQIIRVASNVQFFL